MKSHLLNKLSLVTILILLLSNNSMALVEARLGYGALNSKPNLGGFYGGDLPGAAPNAGLTLDAIVTIPLVGLGGGLRYENMNIAYNSSVLDVKNELKRTSLILNYRIINTLIYLGPIFTYGLSHTNEIKLSSNGTDLSKITSDSVSSYSYGIEAGASLIGFLVGAEVGNMQMKYKNARDSINSSQVHDLDMSGTYAKIFVGFGI